MKQEIIKPIIRVGNSAGVLVPKSWINGRAKVKLIQKPIKIEKDILEVLEPYLKDVIGVYLVGSYARGEQEEKSDVDVLVITEKENNKIIKNRYNMILISEENLRGVLKENAIPLIPMLREAKPIINSNLLKKYKKNPLTERNLKWYIETTKSAVKINENLIDLYEPDKNISDKIVYSLILRLRGLYIIKCLLRGKTPSKKIFINLTKRITGEKAYEGYLRSKNNEKIREELSIKGAKKLIDYIKEEIKNQEQWIKRRERKKSKV